jgi:hypothetical protein
MHTNLAAAALIALSTLVVCASGHAPARAAAANPTCRMFFSDANPPASVRTMLAQKGHSAAEVCLDARGNVTRYSPVTNVVHGGTGVCWYSVIIFPPGADPSVRPVFVFSTQTFMTAPLQVCPRQDDPRFYRADGVSERVFLALLELATSLSSSDDGFSAAFATPRTQMSFDQQREVSEMRGDILFGDPSTRTRYTLRSVGLRGPTALPEKLVYVLNFVLEPDPRNSWQLEVDLTPAGFKIIDWMKIVFFH